MRKNGFSESKTKKTFQSQIGSQPYVRAFQLLQKQGNRLSALEFCDCIDKPNNATCCLDKEINDVN